MNIRHKIIQKNLTGPSLNAMDMYKQCIKISINNLMSPNKTGLNTYLHCLVKSAFPMRIKSIKNTYNLPEEC